MLHYATVESERATKGQGGNEYIHITLQDEKKKPVYFIGFWGHTLVVEDITTGQELLRVEQKIGKSQKGECKCIWGVQEKDCTATKHNC